MSQNQNFKQTKTKQNINKTKQNHQQQNNSKQFIRLPLISITVGSVNDDYVLLEKRS